MNSFDPNSPFDPSLRPNKWLSVMLSTASESFSP